MMCNDIDQNLKSDGPWLESDRGPKVESWRGQEWTNTGVDSK